MSSPFIGEIRMFGGNFAPAGWMFCEGQLLSIAQNADLFNLIKTTYGGDGQSNFAVPDLRGRVPIHMGKSPISGTTYAMGDAQGVEMVTLTSTQMPIHNHGLQASLNNALGNTVNGNVTGQVGATQIYREVPPAVAMSASSVTPQGGSQPHNNIQPFLAINFIISLFGTIPK